MLQPTNRLTLIDAMRPPPGYTFDAAMAVTFTLDLRALLAAPAAFALAARHDADRDDPQTEPIELLHAIRAHSGNITVFSQAGEISLPPSRRVFAFLERSVVPVTAPRGGVVHPKVWVLRYHDPEGEQPTCLRLLNASRNLTFDTSWDTVLRLDSVAPGSPGDPMAPIADLFEGLASRGIGPLHDRHTTRVASLCEQLRDTSFAPPAGIDAIRAHVVGISDIAAPFPASSDRSLVISPFVSNDFFSAIHPSPVDELVSRQESLDGLSSLSLAQVTTTYAFDDGSNPDVASTDDGLTAEDPGRPLQGVHAKVFAFENGERATVFCGSANATGAAFGRNVEVLFELNGPIGRLGVDRLLSGSDDELGLRAMFQTYLRGEAEPDDPDEVSVDAVRQRLARLEITGQVEASGADWVVTYTSSQPIELPPETEVFCWPLATAGNRRLLPAGAPLDARFEVSLEGISGFLAFEVTHEAVVTRFVVPVPLEGVPEHREPQLLRSLIGNGDRFLRYLLALLAEDTGEMDLLDAVEETSADGTEGHYREGGLPVLESLLRTLRRNPVKLLTVDPLIADLSSDDALPPGFADLWSTLRTVALAPGDEA